MELSLRVLSMTKVPVRFLMLTVVGAAMVAARRLRIGFDGGLCREEVGGEDGGEGTAMSEAMRGGNN
jgi:hypothetical protein